MNCLWATLVCVLAFCLGAHSQAVELFEFIAGNTTNIPMCEVVSKLDYICERIQLNEKAITASTISIKKYCDSPLQRNISLIDSEVDQSDPDLKHEPFVGDDCDALFTYKMENGRMKVVGEVTRKEDNQAYEIESCFTVEPGCHVWKEVRKGEFGAVAQPHGTVSSNLSADDRASNEELLVKGKTDSSTIATYTIKFYYTTDFARVTDDIDMFFSQVITYTNEGYKNSQIPIRVELACTEAALYGDADIGSGIFASYKSRDEIRADYDAASMWVASHKYCGLGNVGVLESGSTFTLIMKDCDGVTLGHEVGHNFGLLHKDAFQAAGVNSIMHYILSHSMINYYSSPDIMYKGQPLGDATHNAAKFIRERRFQIANIGKEQRSCKKSKTVYRPVYAIQSSVTPKLIRIIAPTTCTTAISDFRLTLTNPVGVSCSTPALSAPTQAEEAYTVDKIGDCAFNNFDSGISEMKVSANSWCMSTTVKVELANGSMYSCAINAGESCSSVSVSNQPSASA